jgi:chorismate mutase
MPRAWHVQNHCWLHTGNQMFLPTSHVLPYRVEDILQRVRKKAIALNINPNMISDLFTIMIDEMVETEISEFRNGGNF